jgi:hypothetical protein
MIVKWKNYVREVMFLSAVVSIREVSDTFYILLSVVFSVKCGDD